MYGTCTQYTDKQPVTVTRSFGVQFTGRVCLAASDARFVGVRIDNDPQPWRITRFPNAEVEALPSYNVFIDGPATRLVASRTDAYEASALVNAFLDLDDRFEVSADLWGAFVPDAMLTPALMEECGGNIAKLCQFAP
ncbi:hypothetical protein ACWGHD_19185 [Streptomyces xanthophaeus]